MFDEMDPPMSRRAAWLWSRRGRFTASADFWQLLAPGRRIPISVLIARKVAELQEDEDEKYAGTAAEFGHLVEPEVVAQIPGGMTHNEAMFVSPFCPALAATPDGVSIVSGEVASVCEVKAPSCPWEAQEKGEIIQRRDFPNTAEGRKWRTQLMGQAWVCGALSGVFAVKSPISGIWWEGFEFTQEELDDKFAPVLAAGRELAAAVEDAGLEFREIKGAQF